MCVQRRATSRREDERCAHLFLRRSNCLFTASLRCFAVLGRVRFLSPARPRVLSSGLHMRANVKFNTAAAYHTDEPHVSGAMSNSRFFDPITRSATAQSIAHKSERIACRGERARPLRICGHVGMMYTKTRESDQLSLFRLMLNLGYLRSSTNWDHIPVVNDLVHSHLGICIC